MADAIILSRVPSGPTTCNCQVQFIGADVLGGSVYDIIPVTVDYSANSQAQFMSAFAAAVRARAATINKAGGGNGVTIPANRVLDLPSMNRG